MKVILNISSSKDLENSKQNDVLVYNSKIGMWEKTTINDIVSPLNDRIDKLSNEFKNLKNQIENSNQQLNLKVNNRLLKMTQVLDSFNKNRGI